MFPGIVLYIAQIQFVILAVILISAGSCKKDSSSSTEIFKATIIGASETPPNASTATGDATLTYDKSTRIFTIVVNFTGITAQAAHIHLGDVGVAGNVIFGFTPPVTSPINYTSPALTTTQETDLETNQYYVNIHSAQFPAGEIRGQLIKQ